MLGHAIKTESYDHPAAAIHAAPRNCVCVCVQFCLLKKTAVTDLHRPGGGRRVGGREGGRGEKGEGRLWGREERTTRTYNSGAVSRMANTTWSTHQI